MTILRTNPVSTNDTLVGIGQLSQFICWIDLEVPVGFDEAAGDYLTFSFTLDSVPVGPFPDSFSLVADFIPLQLDGGALNAGPYTGSGYSYTVGRVITDYGDMGGSWSIPGQQVYDHDSPGQVEFARNQYLTTVTAGAGGFAGEGVLIGDADTEVAGWNAQREFRHNPDTSDVLLAGSTFTLECYLQVLPSDFGNPDRSMYLRLLSASMTWVPFVGSPTTYPIDLATAQVGYNAGAAAAPGLFGPYAYNALRAVEVTPPPASSVFQDVYVWTAGLRRPTSSGIQYKYRAA